MAEPNIMFRFRFGAKSAEPEPNWTVASVRMTDLHIPAGKYYLADAGFPICDALVIPKRGVRYHLAEWGRAQQRCRIFIQI